MVPDGVTLWCSTSAVSRKRRHNLARYTFGQKDAISEKDVNVQSRFQRMREEYPDIGTLRFVSTRASYVRLSATVPSCQRRINHAT